MPVTTRTSKTILTVLTAILLMSLGVYTSNTLTINREKTQFTNISNRLAQLNKNLLADKNIGMLGGSGVINNCGYQNIGKTEKHLQCFSELKFIRNEDTKDSAAETVNKMEAYVRQFSSLKTYPTRVNIDNESSWSYVSEPKVSDHIMCKFKYDYSLLAKDLKVSQTCFGDAIRAYYPIT